MYNNVSTIRLPRISGSSLRKKIGVLLLSIAVIPFVLSFHSNSGEQALTETCRLYITGHLSDINLSLDRSARILQETNPSEKKRQLISEYRKQRKAYKEIEFFIEYYSAFDAKFFINGPLIPKSDIEYGARVYEPQGFQVMEDLLFSEGHFNAQELQIQIRLLKEKLSELRIYYSTITIDAANIREALQLQMIRISCLTLNGYDCTINKESLPENAASLDGIHSAMKFFRSISGSTPSYKRACKDLSVCRKKLLAKKNSDSFDRLGFLSSYLNPAYTSLSSYFNSLNLPSSQVSYAVNFKDLAAFSISSINKQHFSVYRDDTLHQTEQALLGKLLFFDPLLSENNKRSCASCHKPALAFTDGFPKSPAFDGVQSVQRNAPTLLNVAYQKLFFYDGRAMNLESQADHVFHNNAEMNMNKTEIVSRLRRSPEYLALFGKAFRQTADTAVTFYAVIKSLAEYLKTLDSKNSRFDQYLSGNHKALSQDEIQGFNLFNGKALCGSCHFYPLFNSTVPPMFNDNEFEVIGVAQDSTNRVIDGDHGREKITGQAIHQYAFKTPGLRNVALTAPYMHNGAYKTLDQVLDFYNNGGGAQLKPAPGNQTLPFDSLHLSTTELKAIKAFLLSLTDTSGLSSVPARLPVLPGSNLNLRKVGGNY